jgi:hypothetical protein
MSEEIRKFSEFARGKKHLIGEKMKLKDVLGIPIVVTGYKVDKSKFKENDYVAIQFYKVGEEESHVIFTGAKVLRDQLDEYHEYLPFESTIKKLGTFYSFT